MLLKHVTTLCYRNIMGRNFVVTAICEDARNFLAIGKIINYVYSFKHGKDMLHHIVSKLITCIHVL